MLMEPAKAGDISKLSKMSHPVATTSSGGGMKSFKSKAAAAGKQQVVLNAIGASAVERRCQQRPLSPAGEPGHLWCMPAWGPQLSPPIRVWVRVRVRVRPGILSSPLPCPLPCRRGDSVGQTALMCAAEKGHKAAVLMLLQVEGRKPIVNKPDIYGNTALSKVTSPPPHPGLRGGVPNPAHPSRGFPPRV
jgi:hypothetical protein